MRVHSVDRPVRRGYAFFICAIFFTDVGFAYLAALFSRNLPFQENRTTDLHTICGRLYCDATENIMMIFICWAMISNMSRECLMPLSVYR